MARAKKVKSIPDHTIKPVQALQENPPEIYAVAVRTTPESDKRRTFIKNLAQIAGITSLAKVLSGCGSPYEYEIINRKFDFAGGHKSRGNHPLSSAPYPIFRTPSHIRPPHRFLPAGKLVN